MYECYVCMYVYIAYRILSALFIRSIANDIADTFMSKKSVINTNILIARFKKKIIITSLFVD